MKVGHCRLCHAYGELSFEHVPPKVSYNKTTRYKSVPFLDFIKSDDIKGSTFKSKIQQGGIGFYSLCKPCNNKLGVNYVSAYHNFVKTIGYLGARNTYNHFVVEIRELELLKILKQICSMFLSINDIHFSNTHPELADFVNNLESQTLPELYRFFMYINTEGNFRHLPVLLKGNFNSNISILCSEIAFPPVGLVMTIDYKGQMDYLTEITHFKNYKLADKLDIDLGIYKLPTFSPFPLDYRHLDEIQDAMKDNSSI